MKDMAGWIIWILILTKTFANRNTEDGDEDDEDIPAHKRQSVQYSTLVGPSFVNQSIHAHAHAPVGQTAYLNCIVKNLHNYTVSWVRAKDIHLLTAGETTYTSDSRFVSVNPGRRGHWMLRIHHVQLSDSGTYLCQVSVSPPVSTSVTLLVTEAVSLVKPGKDIYLKAGSRVVLTCEVLGCPYPAFPAWYRGTIVQSGVKINEDRTKNSFPISSEIHTTTLSPINTKDDYIENNLYEKFFHFEYSSKGNSLKSSQERRLNWDDSFAKSFPQTSTIVRSTTPIPHGPPMKSMSTTSVGLPVATATLIRSRAQASHSGVYTCKSACTDPVNLTLHVLTGDEETAAMQHPSHALSIVYDDFWKLEAFMCLFVVLSII